MAKVSIIVPARQEPYLVRTVADLLAKAGGDIEILVVLDGGSWPNPPITDDPRVSILRRSVSQGMRPAINAGIAMATGTHLLKIDAHCAVAPGYDVALAAHSDDAALIVPRRYDLDVDAWAPRLSKPGIDAHRLSYPFPTEGLHGRVWAERAAARLDIPIDDEMSSQGSAWFCSKRHWRHTIRRMQVEQYSTFALEMQELGLKTWCGGGRLLVDKTTWYAHMRSKRHYVLPEAERPAAERFCTTWWVGNRWPKRTREFRTLIEAFWPTPGWPASSTGALDWDQVERDFEMFTRRRSA